MGPTIDNLAAAIYMGGPSKVAADTGRMLARLGGHEKTAFGFGAVEKSLGGLKPFGAIRKAVKAISPGWRTKALGTGLAVAGGYGVYKGLQAGKQYMMQPSYGTTQYQGGAPLQANVNQYGYPQY